MAERCLQLACKRALERKVFGKRMAEHGMAQYAIAQSRIEIDQARLLVLQTAFYIDRAGPKVCSVPLTRVLNRTGQFQYFSKIKYLLSC